MSSVRVENLKRKRKGVKIKDWVKGDEDRPEKTKE